MKPIEKVLKKRSLEKKLIRLYTDQITSIQMHAHLKGIKFNDALRQILDAAIGKKR